MTETTPEAEALERQDRNRLIGAWLKKSHEAKVASDAEKALREELIKALFAEYTGGTNRYTSPEGYGAIKVGYNYTYSLGDAKMTDSSGLKVPIADQVNDLLTDIENLGERGALIAGRIVKWEPKLIVDEYEMLAGSENAVDIEAKLLIDKILTVKGAFGKPSYEPPAKKGA